LRWRLKDERESLRGAGSEFQFEWPAYTNERPPYEAWDVEMTMVSRSQVATTRNVGEGLAVGRQVAYSGAILCRHLNEDSEPNPVDNVQPV